MSERELGPRDNVVTKADVEHVLISILYWQFLLLFVGFLVLIILIGVKWYLVIYNVHFLMANDVKYL